METNQLTEKVEIKVPTDSTTCPRCKQSGIISIGIGIIKDFKCNACNLEFNDIIFVREATR